tara:strand:- start:98 stop:460 length:363 start_codon:yes stop_codon:yes gene_type:complete
MEKRIVVYSYGKCSTCRKAIKWLTENKLSFDLLDIVETPPGKNILMKALKNIENRKKIFNVNGLSYREIGSNIISSMTDEEALQALLEDGKLIKRPFLISKNGQILLGFKEENWSKILLN